MRRLHRAGLIGQAIQTVPISDVLSSLGVLVETVPAPGTNIRVDCPFAYLHPDGKDAREFRVYSDGKGYCHICLNQYDSVSLAAQAWGCGQSEAARRLLSGQKAVTELSASRSMYATRAGAVAALAEWADANNVDRFSAAYRKCLTAADTISVPEQVAPWLAACKRVLAAIPVE